MPDIYYILRIFMRQRSIRSQMIEIISHIVCALRVYDDDVRCYDKFHFIFSIDNGRNYVASGFCRQRRYAQMIWSYIHQNHRNRNMKISRNASQHNNSVVVARCM